MSDSNPVSNTNWTLIFLCWVIASVSVLGSMFFSAIMEYAPCVLCWYQRIFMFPLVLIFLVGMFPTDKNVVRYALPIAMVGWGLALYHMLLYSGLIPQEMEPCSQGVSCTETYIDLFGFITIPMLSFLSFSVIVALLVVLRRRFSK